MNSHPRLSIVVPVHNEAGNIEPLHAELTSVLDAGGDLYEIIYVNDGSTDNSFKELCSLTNATIIDLNRNYGQATALDAGFKEATGDIIVSLDGDGQNDPQDIPRLVRKLEEEDLDVVAGWRQKRSDRQGIKVLTRIGRSLRHLFIKDTVHDTGCTLRAYRSEAAKSLDIGGEMHRYILALLRWKGFTIGELPVTDRARVFGVSKYGYSKAIRGGIDLIYIWFIHKYSQRPLHLFGYVSLASFLLGMVSLFWTLYGKFALDLSLNRNGWFFLTFFFLLAALILFSFGIVIDLLIRIQYHTSGTERRYYLRSVVKI